MLGRSAARAAAAAARAAFAGRQWGFGQCPLLQQQQLSPLLPGAGYTGVDVLDRGQRGLWTFLSTPARVDAHGDGSIPRCGKAKSSVGGAAALRASPSSPTRRGYLGWAGAFGRGGFGGLGLGGFSGARSAEEAAVDAAITARLGAFVNHERKGVPAGAGTDTDRVRGV